MKKAIALCTAAVLAAGISTTAYAAPLRISNMPQSVCGQDLNGILQQMLMQKLEQCLPGCQNLPTCPSKPVDKPNVEKPADKPNVEKPTDKPSIDKPDTEQPGCKPGITLPGTPDTEKPADKPVVGQPTDKPSTENPDNNQTNTDITGVSAYAAKVVDLVHAERAKAGLSALSLDLTASQAAQVRAAEIRSSFSHTRPSGKNCFTALTEAGVEYRTAGENIAAGQKTPEQVVTAWMNSEGHRKNILGSQFTAIGVGYLEGGYWTQFFIG